MNQGEQFLLEGDTAYWLNQKGQWEEIPDPATGRPGPVRSKLELSTPRPLHDTPYARLYIGKLLQLEVKNNS
ncbi:hypothetical protein HYZ97_04345 [Candidatus Pacearchaeota archaeon]|nr:hypothetical protein [Candidatus Pacearchaeota archaeon]